MRVDFAFARAPVKSRHALRIAATRATHMPKLGQNSRACAFIWRVRPPPPPPPPPVAPPPEPPFAPPPWPGVAAFAAARHSTRVVDRLLVACCECGRAGDAAAPGLGSTRMVRL